MLATGMKALIILPREADTAQLRGSRFHPEAMLDALRIYHG